MAKRTRKTPSEKYVTRQRTATPQATPPMSAAVAWDAVTIKALRAHMQLTQTQMAAALGTRQQTISEWEVGLHKPRGGY